MKKLICITALLFVSLIVLAQPNEVTLIVTGEGATKELATNKALRSAVEQAFGVFVSANTKILNDELVKDEIATISSGNVKSFKEISVTEVSSERISITLEAVVSIGNLVEYSKVHGAKAEFAGAVFGANLRLRELRKKSERDVISGQISLLNTVRKQLFQANIKVGNPTMKRVNLFRYDAENGDWRGKDCHAYLVTDKYPLCDSFPEIEYPASLGYSLNNSSNAGDKSYVLPLLFYYQVTPQGKELFKEFFRVINSITLSDVEKKEYDVESIPYYTVNWINKRQLYFRDVCSVIILSELVRIINRSLFDDWVVKINTSESIIEIIQKTNPSLFDMLEKRMRLFGLPCSPSIEYYVWLMRGKADSWMFKTNSSFPSLHCDIDANSGTVRFSSSEERDVIDDEKAIFIFDMLRAMYGSFKGESVKQTGKYVTIHNDYLPGKTIRSLEGLGGNLVLSQKESPSYVDIVDIHEMPVTLDIFEMYHNKCSFSSLTLYNILTDQANIVYQYSIELPMEQNILAIVTSVEVSQNTN